MRCKAANMYFSFSIYILQDGKLHLFEYLLKKRRSNCDPSRRVGSRKKIPLTSGPSRPDHDLWYDLIGLSVLDFPSCISVKTVKPIQTPLGSNFQFFFFTVFGMNVNYGNMQVV